MVPFRPNSFISVTSLFLFIPLQFLFCVSVLFYDNFNVIVNTSSSSNSCLPLLSHLAMVQNLWNRNGCCSVGMQREQGQYLAILVFAKKEGEKAIA